CRMNEQQALDVLNKYFADSGDTYLSSSTLDNWDIAHGEERDIFSFLPAGGKRSNRIYLVKNDKAFAFSPAEMDFTEAMEKLESL
ncbi:MAG TPA: hypothetical protein PK000_04000, partial [Candidatus Saccharibacteria bacterium]|nr:hypothetical protein [Candidatus Saccharibacteria bacterium]